MALLAAGGHGIALLAILLNRIAVAVSGRDAPRVERQHRHC